MQKTARVSNNQMRVNAVTLKWMKEDSSSEDLVKQISAFSLRLCCSNTPTLNRLKKSYGREGEMENLNKTLAPTCKSKKKIKKSQLEWTRTPSNPQQSLSTLLMAKSTMFYI